MAKRIDIDLGEIQVSYRMRRGKLVRIPDRWVGKIPMTGGRLSHVPRKVRNATDHRMGFTNRFMRNKRGETLKEHFEE